VVLVLVFLLEEEEEDNEDGAEERFLFGGALDALSLFARSPLEVSEYEAFVSIRSLEPFSH
jgi:hypothetical protein